jgi:N-acetylmuramoyl-L-alanine amidase
MNRNRSKQHEACPGVSGDQSRQPCDASGADEGDTRTVERAKHTPRVLVALLLTATTASCVGAGVEEATTSTSLTAVTTTDGGPSTTGSTTPTTTTTSPFEELAAGALITPSGVVVAIVDRGVTGFVVQTPCDNTTTIGTGEPVGRVEVVLDPGHGGPIDSGAVGANGLREADVNLAVAKITEQLLEERGISVLLSRTADYAVRIPFRSQLADGLDAEILVSIHHNAPTPEASTTPGTEIFIQSHSEKSRRLGGLIWEHIVDGLSRIDGAQWHAAPDAGVLMVMNSRGEDSYGMVRLPETVSVLAELAYMSAPSEAEVLATQEYLITASEALADAIEAYLRGNDLGAGYVDEPRVFNPLPGLSAGNCEDPDLG